MKLKDKDQDQDNNNEINNKDKDKRRTMFTEEFQITDKRQNMLIHKSITIWNLFLTSISGKRLEYRGKAGFVV